MKKSLPTLSKTIIIPCALLVMLLSTIASAQNVGDINTIAGTGETGYNGDGIDATQAVLLSPEDVAVDPAGNIYIADRGNYRIRKVDAATGLISTIAGDGTLGYSGDGGLAVDAQVHNPRGIAVDAAGNIYFTEHFFHVIRKIDVTTGIITRVAGTPGVTGTTGDGSLAVNATLASPYGLTIAANGDIYVACYNGHNIRKIEDATDNISTVAGTDTGIGGFGGDMGPATAAQLNRPIDVALDNNGDLYISEFSNTRIRKVDIATGAGDIFTIAGNGINTNNGDMGPATAASIHSPYGLTFDVAGNLYFSTGNLIRKIDNAGIITTYSTSSSQLDLPVGLSTVGGDLYIADLRSERIRKIDMLTNNTTTVAGGFVGDGGPAIDARLNYPTGVAIDVEGNIYIADGDNYCIRKVDAVSGVITTVAGFPGVPKYYGDGGPATDALLRFSRGGITLDTDGNIYYVGSENNVIRKIDIVTGIISTVVGTGDDGYSGDNGPATSAELDYPTDMVFDSQGNMYIADADNNVIRKVDTNGVITTVAGTPGDFGYSGDGGLAFFAKFEYIEGLGIDNQDNLYIADAENNRVRKIDALSWKISLFAGNGGSDIFGDGGLAIAAEIDYPTDVAVDAAGNVYIMDNNYIIRKVDTNGIITSVAGVGGSSGSTGDDGPATAALLDYAEGLTVDPFGNIYIADSENDKIRYIFYCDGPERPALSASKATTCSGDQVTLSVTGGSLNDATDWNWYSGSCGGTTVVGTGASVNVSPKVTTTYYVRGQGNCVVSGPCSEITINVNPLPAVTANTTAGAVCDGEAVTLTGSGDEATYSWDNAITEGIAFVPAETATYTVTATDANGCQDTDNITVTVNPLPVTTAIATNTSLCEGSGEEVTLIAAGNTAGTFSWDNGATNGVAFTPAATTDYTVTMTDTNGCVDTDQVTISVNPLPVVTANASATTVCVGSQVTFTGSGAATYTWNNGVADGTPFTISTTTTFTVTGTGADGCTGTDQITVTVNPLPATPNVTATGDILETGDYQQYQWYLNGQPVSGAVSKQYTPAESGDYTVEVTDGNGCTAISGAFTYVVTGLEDISGLREYSVYPNPTQGSFILFTRLKQTEIVSYSLHDTMGKIIVHKELGKVQTIREQLDLSGYEGGIYYLAVMIGGKRYTHKIRKE